MPLTALGLYLVLGCCWVGNFLRPIYGIMGYLIIYSIYNPDAWWVRVTNGFLPRPSFIAMVFVVLGALINFNKLNWNISRKEWLFYLFLVLCWISTFVFWYDYRGRYLGICNENDQVICFYIFFFYELLIL